MSGLPLWVAEALPREHAEQDRTEYTWKSEAGGPIMSTAVCIS